MPLKGLFYGGGTQVLIAQAIGSAIITVSTFVVALVLMYAVNAMGLLRVSEEGEKEGLDLHEHGISAYPEYVISAMASPAAMTIPAGIVGPLCRSAVTHQTRRASPLSGERTHMKKIEAIIQPFKLDEVKEAFAERRGGWTYHLRGSWPRPAERSHRDLSGRRVQRRCASQDQTGTGRP